MSDAKSLLRAHKAQAGPSQQVADPYATTTAKGELRCSICVVPGEQCNVLAAESLILIRGPHTVKHWAAHTASKQHKTSLQRVRAEEAKAAAKAQKRRKVEAEPAGVAEDEAEGPALPPGMQGDAESIEGPARKKARIAEASNGSGTPSAPAAAVDDELDSFLSSIAAIPAEPVETPQASTSKSRKPYKPAEPDTQTSYEAAPSLILPAASGEEDSSTITAGATAATNPFASRLAAGAVGPVAPTGPAVEEEEEEEETDAQRRERLQREEREEIMDRLAEETRAQYVTRLHIVACRY